MVVKWEVFFSIKTGLIKIWKRDDQIFLWVGCPTATVYIPFENSQVMYLRQLKIKPQIYQKKKKDLLETLKPILKFLSHRRQGFPTYFSLFTGVCLASVWKCTKLFATTWACRKLKLHFKHYKGLKHSRDIELIFTLKTHVELISKSGQIHKKCSICEPFFIFTS